MDDLDGYSSGPCHRHYVMICYVLVTHVPEFHVPELCQAAGPMSISLWPPSSIQNKKLKLQGPVSTCEGSLGGGFKLAGI